MKNLDRIAYVLLGAGLAIGIMFFVQKVPRLEKIIQSFVSAPDQTIGAIAGVISAGEDPDSSYQIRLAFGNDRIEKFDEYHFNPSELYRIKAGDLVIKSDRFWTKVLATAQIAKSDQSFSFKNGEWIAFTKDGPVKITEWKSPVGDKKK